MLRLNLFAQLATGDTILIEADNLTELNQALNYLQSIGALRSGPAIPPPAEPSTSDKATGPATPVSEPQEAEPAEKPKRQSKKASAGSAAPAADGEATEKAQAVPATSDKPKVKIEDVTSAITSLANKTSLQVARGVLEKFGVKRAGELKPDQFADVIAACEAASAEGGSGGVDDVL